MESSQSQWPNVTHSSCSSQGATRYSVLNVLLDIEISPPRLTESADRLLKFDRRMLVPPTRSGVAHNSETPAFTLIDNGEIVRSGMTEHECKLNLVWYISQCALYRDTLLSFTPGVSLRVLESFCQLRPAPANRSLLRP